MNSNGDCDLRSAVSGSPYDGSNRTSRGTHPVPPLGLVGSLHRVSGCLQPLDVGLSAPQQLNEIRKALGQWRG